MAGSPTNPHLRGPSPSPVLYSAPQRYVVTTASNVIPYKDNEPCDNIRQQPVDKYANMLPHGGVDMTFGELQEITVRQQRELEAQQKILLTKEQRLKFLRNQDAQHLQIAAENERLRKLRERVESQELKLKKLRALRGQAEQQKVNNGNLGAELESIKAIFNEKEKELSLAVAKVDHLTNQLEQLRLGKFSTNGKVNTDHPNAMAAVELDKLKKKLALRNKQNEQQNTKMTQQRDILLKRRNEVNSMDKRIVELQQRLKKRLAQQIQNNKQNEQNRANKLNHVRQGSNVAAIEPYHHAPRQNASIDETYSDQSFNKDSPKYQSLPVNTKVTPNGTNIPEQEKISDSISQGKSEIDTDYKIPLVVSVEKYPGFNSTADPPPPPGTFKSKDTNQVPPSSNGEHVFKFPSTAQNRSAMGIANFVPKPFGSTYSTSMLSGRGANAYSTPAMPEEVRQDGSGQSSPATSENSNTVMMPQQQQQHPASPSMYPVKIPSSQHSNGNGNYVSISNVNIKMQPLSGPTATLKNITSQQTDNVGQKSGQNWTKTGSIGPFVNAYNKAQVQVAPTDVVDHRSTVTLPQKESPESGGSKNHTKVSGHNEDYTTSGGVPSSHPTNPALSKPRYATGTAIENAYTNRLGNDARETYQQQIAAMYSSGEPVSGDLHQITGAEINQQSKELQQQQQQKIHERPTSHDAERSPAINSSQLKPKHMTTPPGVSPQHRDLASDKGSFKAHTPKNVRRRHSDSEEDLSRFMRRSGEQPRSVSTSAISHVSQHPADTSDYALSNGNRQRPSNKAYQYYDNSDYSPNGVPSVPSSNGGGRYSNQGYVVEGAKKLLKTRLPGKSLLKIAGSKNLSRRVTFDPLALLLDASLEGELGLVMKTAQEVVNVSASNDEGITALHNAICAGHYDIVKFLVEFGCDVNAPDSDGWTPLHCAASCNNLPMVQLLVNHGACIFATTISDHETAAEKCEEDEDGYDGCSEYLYSVQEKLGIVNNGIVYSIFDYDAENSDELNFKMGNQLTILRKGDEQEKEWWWARLQDQEGYIARNLLGLQPRVSPEHSRWLNS